MIRGIDTTFMVEAEVTGHKGHQPARTLFQQLIDAGDLLALAPQVLAEFVHVVTDPRRFSQPLRMADALARTQVWWQSAEVVQVVPTDESTRLFLAWMKEHRLGRKRLLDTQLAATYYQHGVRSVVSTNARDYAVFGCFEVLVPS